MPIKLNFEGVNVDGGGFEPWPVRTPVEFTISKIEPKIGRDSGKPYLEFEMNHVGSKRKAWSNFSLQPQALWMLKRLLLSLGIPREELEGDFDLEPRDLIGKTVYILFDELRPSAYDGKERQEIIEIRGEYDID